MLENAYGADVDPKVEDTVPPETPKEYETTYDSDIDPVGPAVEVALVTEYGAEFRNVPIAELALNPPDTSVYKDAPILVGKTVLETFVIEYGPELDNTRLEYRGTEL